MKIVVNVVLALYIVLFWILLIINIDGIGSRWIFSQVLKKDVYWWNNNLLNKLTQKVKLIFYNNITKPDLLKIDKKSYKNIDIYYKGYITIKKIDD